MSAQIGLLTVQIFIPLSHSLKEKRKVVKRIKNRVQNKFNVSIAETNFLDKWQRGELSITIIGNNKTVLDQSLQKVGRYIEEISMGDAEILSYHIEFL